MNADILSEVLATERQIGARLDAERQATWQWLERLDYGQALAEMHLSEGHEGTAAIESLAATAAREVGVTVEECNALGVHYRELTIYGPFIRSPSERNYGYTLTSPHLEESIHLFESIVATMLEIAAFESKVKMLAREITRVTRTTRVLEERVVPRLRAEIRGIIEHISEREREANFRLRRFKAGRVTTRIPDAAHTLVWRLP